ncbi:hypothetical protein ABKV19_016997 [Rosa sericea]
MMGSKFVEKVRDYLLSVGEEVQGIAIIPSNPDQSKRLETARMRILNVWVDFVNLHCAEYSYDSRIPTMVNSCSGMYGSSRVLFVTDLSLRTLVTLPYFEIKVESTLKIATSSYFCLRKDGTRFRHLALKVLRSTVSFECISSIILDNSKAMGDLTSSYVFCLTNKITPRSGVMMGTKFNFILDEQLKEAAACDEVKAALSAKISRKRIGAEIDLMISANQPVQAMTYICDLKLFWVVFSLHPHCEPSEGCDSDCVSYLDCTWNPIHIVGHSIFNDEQRMLSFYAAMFLQLRKTMYKDRKAKDGRELLEGLRMECEQEREWKWEEWVKKEEEKEKAREQLKKQRVQEWEAFEKDSEERERDKKKRRSIDSSQPAGLSDHTGASNYYLSQMMQNLHHVNSLDQFIVDG